MLKNFNNQYFCCAQQLILNGSSEITKQTFSVIMHQLTFLCSHFHCSDWAKAGLTDWNLGDNYFHSYIGNGVFEIRRLVTQHVKGHK